MTHYKNISGIMQDDSIFSLCGLDEDEKNFEYTFNKSEVTCKECLSKLVIEAINDIILIYNKVGIRVSAKELLKDMTNHHLSGIKEVQIIDGINETYCNDEINGDIEISISDDGCKLTLFLNRD